MAAGMKIRTKRVYDPPANSDGYRVLIDRLWPRGLSKQVARVDYWAKSCSPSSELRKWYGHDPAKWEEFRRRYFLELESNPEAVAEFHKHVPSGLVTLLFSSRETDLNNATAFREYVESSPAED